MKSRINNPTFSAYMDEINKYPLMTRAEEEAVARDWVKTKNPKASEKLIRANLRFVAKVAYRYASSGHDMMDLIQEGNLGLLRALKHFDPEKGYKFITYGVWWIHAYLKTYLITNQSQVKFGTTGAQRNLYFKLRGEKAKQMALYNEIDYDELSSILGEDKQAIMDADARLAQKDFSLQSMIGEDGETTFQDMLADRGMSALELAENRDRKDGIDEALSKLSLNGKEWAILEKRLKSLDPLTLNELGQEFGVSRERIRQIESRLKDKIRRELKKEEYREADSRFAVDAVS